LHNPRKTGYPLRCPQKQAKDNRKLSPILKYIILPLLIIAALYGEEIEDTLKIYRSETIVVGAEKEIPGTSVITTDELNLKSTYNLAQSLRLLGFVNVVSGSKGVVKLQIRGSRAEDVAVYIDGAPVNGGFYGRPDFSFIDDIGVAAVAVNPGPACSGQNPSSVNIITKKRVEGFKPAACVKFGSGRFVKASSSVGGKINDFSFDAAAGYSRRDHIRLSSDFEPTEFENGGIRDNTDFERFSGQIGIGWKSPPKADIDTRFQWHSGERGIPSPTDKARYWRFADWHSARISTSVDFKNADVTAFLDDYFDRLIEYKSAAFDDDSVKYDSRLGVLSGGANIRLNTPVIKGAFPLTLQAGGAFKMDNVRRQMDVGENWEYHSLVFSSCDLTLRADFVSRYSIGIGGTVSNFYLPDDGKNRSDLTGSIFCKIEHNPALPIARLEFAGAMRYPTPNELFCPFRGNLNLEPQRSMKAELGLFGTKPIDYSLAVFGNITRDYIFSAGRDDVYENLEGATRSGIESEIGVEIPAGFLDFQIDVGAFYIDVIDGDEKTLANIPRLKFIATVTISPRIGPTIESDFTSLSNRTDADGSAIPNYELFGARIRYPFSVISVPVEITASVDNIFDVDYEEEPGFPAPGRNFFLGLSVGE